MACKTSFDWHHNFPKLAAEAGFAFNYHRARILIDWSKIKLIDIEAVIKNRDFTTIEGHINDVLDCTLESEFNVKILDEGVVKLFRLAQLAVEYQQFCRQYLDRSVLVLRNELNSTMQEVDKLKRELRVKDDEARKFRKRAKITKAAPVYGNDNIATMILRTLSNRGDIFSTTSLGETVPQYNKCNYCGKVFLNQLYLQSHQIRRHGNTVELPERDSATNQKAQDTPPKSNVENTDTTNKLQQEIVSLKEKLHETEKCIIKIQETEKQTQDTGVMCSLSCNLVEAATKSEEYQEIIKNFEQWKAEENKKYKQEMDDLKNSILENIVKSGISKVPRTKTYETDVIQELKLIINKQTDEIQTLKEEITKVNKQNQKEIDDDGNPKEIIWKQQMKNQEEIYEKKLDQLSRTLEQVYNEAKTARQLIEQEREKITLLQNQLHEKENTISELYNRLKETNKNDDKEALIHYKRPTGIGSKTNVTIESNGITKLPMDELHRKAKELLNRNLNYSTSDGSEIEMDNSKQNMTGTALQKKSSLKPKTNDKTDKISIQVKKSSEQRLNITPESDMTKIRPTKIIRAKLNEEVNSRMSALGLDPLQKGVPAGIFAKHRTILLQQHDIKAKKNAIYREMRNKILSKLDSQASNKFNHDFKFGHEYDMGSKINSRVTTIFSNVKNKALSLMRPHERLDRVRRNVLNQEIVKKASTLLKTPPDSVSNSPKGKKSVNVHSIKTNISGKTTYHNVKNTVKLSDMSSVKQNKEPLVDTRKFVRSYDSISSESESELNSNEDVLSLNEYDNRNVNAINKDGRPKNGTSASNSLLHSYELHKKTENKLISNERELKSKSKDDSLKKGNPATNISRAFSADNVTADSKIAINMYNASETDTDENQSTAKKYLSEETLLTRSSPSTAKGVLKNAPSQSSLSKKRVLFDLDAIQMKSISDCSSSQDKAETKVIDSIGQIDFNDDWDISSIDDVPVKIPRSETVLVESKQTKTKVTELTKRIESQLAKRVDIKPPAGSIDLANVSNERTLHLSGSNTSLGSSLLDDSCEANDNNELLKLKSNPTKHDMQPIPAPRQTINTNLQDDASDLDLSDWSPETEINKNKM